MPESLTWTLNVQVVGGPKISVYDTLMVEAYDKIEAVIPAATDSTAGSATVNVQPGSGVQFLLITASSYENLTYKVDGNVTATLDGTHVFIGAGAVRLLGTTQKQFVFENASDKDITVSILVGRDANL
jgi:hypothetical protein